MGKSKLANLMFTYELPTAAYGRGPSQVPSRSVRTPVFADTELMHNSSRRPPPDRPRIHAVSRPAGGHGSVTHAARRYRSRGARRPVLRSRWPRPAQGASGGGRPPALSPTTLAIQQRLWAISEELTGVTFRV